MDLAEELLASWGRQAEIVNRVAELVTADTRSLLPSADGMSLDRQLTHIGEVRYSWLAEFSPSHAQNMGATFRAFGKAPPDDLGEVRAELASSAKEIEAALRGAFERGATNCGPYDHPVYFLQHMVWHEGWHVGLILLGLRLGGYEPNDEWEEANVWGAWRTE